MKIIVLGFDELEHMFNSDQYSIVKQYITFRDLLPLFLHKGDGSDKKIAVWECIEADFDIDAFNYEVFDLMLDLFEEDFNKYVEHIIGESIERYDYIVANVINNAVYLKLYGISRR